MTLLSEQRHWQNGLAEVVKYGVIYDGDFFRYLQAHAGAILQRDVAEAAEVIKNPFRLLPALAVLSGRNGNHRHLKPLLLQTFLYHSTVERSHIAVCDHWEAAVMPFPLEQDSWPSAERGLPRW